MQIFHPPSLKVSSVCSGCFLPRMCIRVWKSEAQTLVEGEDRRKEGEGKEKRGQVLVIPTDATISPSSDAHSIIKWLIGRDQAADR